MTRLQGDIMNKNIFFLLTAFLISAPCWAASDGMSEAERTRLIQLSVGRAFEGVLGAVVTNGEPLEDAIEGLVGNISHSPQPEDVYFDLQALRAFIQQQIDAAWQNMKDHGLTLDRLELRSDQPDVGLHVVHALRKYDAGLSEIERNARRDADAIKEALADLERVAQSRPATSDPVPSSVTPPSTDTSSDEDRKSVV